MTSVPVTEPLALVAPRDKRWSGLGEFLLVGGLTPLLFPLSWLLRRALGLETAELVVGFSFFYAAYVINDPHFAVTYLLFYKDARARALGAAFAPWQRARYLFAGFVAPLALVAWAITGLARRSAPTLGLMIQLMFLLVGWHYVKQGFGVMTVLSARRGVTYRPFERFALLAHCFTGWAFAWATPFDPGTEVEEKGLVYTSIAHPPGLVRVTQIAVLATLALVVVVLIQKRRREGRLPVLTPLMALACSIWPWSIFSGIDPLVRYMTPALHSVQYLYFVWILKHNEARDRERAPWFEPSPRARLGMLAVSALALGWFLFHLAPWAFDDLVRPRDRETDLGPTPYLAAITAFVNIHHYLMDHVIWRRENPLTRYLRAGPAQGDRA